MFLSKRHYSLLINGMFAYILFGSSKSVFSRGLENDLAYTSKFVVIYICGRLIAFTHEDGERRIERKVSVEAESLQEKIIWFGRKN